MSRPKYGRRVEILFPDEDQATFDALEAHAQDARIGVGPLIRAALRAVDLKQIAESLRKAA